MSLMKYVSIDLETTGLDPNSCQILEVAAVVDDWVSSIDSLPRFHAYLYHEQLSGHPRALAMNARILDILGKKEDADIVYGDRNLSSKLRNFIFEHKDGLQMTAAGKNFGTFDLPFLRNLQGFDQDLFMRRVLDPGVLYFNPRAHGVIPDTNWCCDIAGIDERTDHSAMGDALLTIKLLRKHYGFPVY